jgi:hypothetical protein
MAQYIGFVEATSNSTLNTEDTFFEIDLPAGQIAKIKRVRVSFNTAAQDGICRILMCRKSATGAGTTAALTEVKKDPLSPAALAVGTIKSTTNTWAAGTKTDTVDDVAVNTRGIFEWVARDDQDYIVTDSGGIFGVNLFVSIASIKCKVTVEWIE